MVLCSTLKDAVFTGNATPPNNKAEEKQDESFFPPNIDSEATEPDDSNERNTEVIGTEYYHVAML